MMIVVHPNLIDVALLDEPEIEEALNEVGAIKGMLCRAELGDIAGFILVAETADRSLCLPLPEPTLSNFASEIAFRRLVLAEVIEAFCGGSEG